jgi:hypothetical protein
MRDRARCVAARARCPSADNDAGVRSATRVSPKPKWCEVDYGGGVAVDKKGKAGFVCAGDTTLKSGPALSYGHSLSRGRFHCESQSAGMRCVNKRNGHGFFLSKQRYELF